MKIIHLARHGQTRSNQDEEAITYSLSLLGHEVVCFHETEWERALDTPGDMLLFNKWFNVQALEKVKGRLKRVFWQFDLLGQGSIAKLSKSVRGLLYYADYGFCTDGDWVREHQGEGCTKLHWLPQGADPRMVGRHPAGSPSRILFAGGNSIGSQRQLWIRDMRSRWGRSFHQIVRQHGAALAGHVSGADIVVAPDAPGTDNYWSNRIYLMLGFGAFLIHPYYSGLVDHYEDGKEIIYYRSRPDLHEKIAYYLEHPEERRAIAAAGLERTKRDHTYLQRCQKLMQIVEGS